MQTAGTFVLANRVLSAITAAALGAAVGMILPGPSVQAGTTNPAIRDDVAYGRPLGRDCARQGWPYYTPNCPRYRTQDSGEE